MRVFVAWSGERSQRLALALRWWIRKVVPNVTVWMSTHDATKGVAWRDGLERRLRSADACLVCITSENVEAQWLGYEAGAVACNARHSLVCCFVVGVQPHELDGGPLGRFQHTVPEREDVWRLVQAINRALGDHAHNERLLKFSFRAHWPRLQKRLGAIVN